MDISVSVVGQKMYLQTGNYIYAPGTNNFVRFLFDLSDDWDGYMMFAQWRQGNNTYNAYLDSANRAYLPMEIVSGECTMMLCGTLSTNHVGTTKPVKLCIVDDVYVSDSNSTGLTKDQYEAGIAALDGKIPVANVTTTSEAKSYIGI